MSNSQTKLLNSISGKRIERAAVVVSSNDEGHPEDVLAVGIAFSHGRSLIFGCAGDGSVSIRKGNLEDFRVGPGSSIALREISELGGAEVSQFSYGGGVVSLSAEGHTLEIENRDDEIYVRIDDRLLRLSYHVDQLLGSRPKQAGPKSLPA